MNPTLSWERVGSAFYRTFEGYSLEWSVNAAENHIRVSPAGGIIAVWPRSEVIRQGSAPSSCVTLYSGLGKVLLRLSLEASSILDAGFTTNEEFVVVARSGHVRRYYDLAGNFALAKVAEPLSAQFGKVTVVELEDKFALVGENVRFLEKPALEGWVLLPGSHEIIYWGNGVSILDADGIHQISRDQVSKILPSPCGDLLAVRGETSPTKVYTTDFSQLLATLEFHSDPIWVGSDALLELKSTRDELEVVVHNLDGGGSSSMFYEPGTIFHSEIDGLRIFTDDKAHNLFCKVPQVSVDIFRLGSNAPSSILLSCIDMLEQNSPRANENLCLISDLPTAISNCCTAATYEVEARVQKRLLRAANFGKSSLELHDSTEYLKALDTIRIANTVRDAKVGLFCTVAQINHLTGTWPGSPVGDRALVSLLEKRKNWETALGIAKMLKMPVESVPIAWACDFIEGSKLEDSALCQALDERLSKYTGLSYVEIGRKAYDEGRIELALQLVSREPNARRRIELLMDMGEYDMALEQSVRSEHTDLIYYVLFLLQKKLPLPQFYRAFRDNEAAVRCYQAMLKMEKTTTKLHEFNYQMDRREDDFKLLLTENFADPEPMLINGLAQQTRGYFGRALGDYSKLLQLQIQLEKDYETEFRNFTATETIAKLLGIGQLQRAQKIKSAFHVSDQQFWHSRINTFIERRDWDGLWQFSQQKSPVGYAPFYEACKDAGNPDAASRYVDMSSASAQEKVQKYIEIGYRDRAVEAAKHDASLLAQISG